MAARYTPRLFQSASRIVAPSSSIISPACLRRGLASVATSEAAPTQTAAPRMKSFEIYRWNPDTPEVKPKMVKYEVDLNQTVRAFLLPH